MKFMVDSGAFTAWTKSEKISLPKYIAFLKKNLHLIDYYIVLDVMNDGEGSKANYIRMREEGLNPIPVYHSEVDPSYLEFYLSQTDYICIGAISNLSSSRRIRDLDYLWDRYLTDKDGMPKAKFHGLGLTTAEIILRYPWHSVDSATWVHTARRGIIVTPRKRNGEYIYNEAPIRIECSSRSPHKAEICGHYETLSEQERQCVDEYITGLGYKMGKSEWVDGKEVIIEKGLCNDYFLRDELNLLYFYSLHNSVPTYPWSFKKKKKQGFLI